MTATKLITLKEVAKRLNKSPITIRCWIRGYYNNGRGLKAQKREFVKPIRIGGTLQFRESDIDRWIAEGTVN